MPTRRDVLSLGFSITATALLKDVALAQAPTAPLTDAAKDPMTLVNPEFRPALEQFTKEMGSDHPLNAATLKTWRGVMNQFATPILPTPPITERTIPSCCISMVVVM
jgi:hypothetical protein